MRWTVHGERTIYESPWVGLVLVDVEVPGGPRFEHHVARFPNDAAGTVVTDPDRGVLLLWRHRFITDTWGWEIPAGALDRGETAAAAAERETLEETGWRPGPLEHLVTYAPMNGSCDQRFHLYRARSASHVGDPVDAAESERIEWRSLQDVRAFIARGEVGDGLSLTGLLWVLARWEATPR
ncbi:MAG: NUDIX domain-containing protein [Acidimicrobiales bacterium]|nr:NUDIX domain-containing protein [Acidimicrobiales bacterium]